MSSDYYGHIAGEIADEGRDDPDPDDYDERLMPPSRDEDDDHDDRDDDWEPDPEDAEFARWYAEEAEHFEQVHGGSGVCNCRPPVRNHVKWRIQAAGRRLGNAWYRARYAARQPWTIRIGPAEFTVRWQANRRCGACSERGWFYSKGTVNPVPVPPGYDGVSLCGCGSAIGKLAGSRRAVRRMRNDPPF